MATHPTAPGDVVEGERGIGHFRHAGDERHERADDRDKTGQDDRLAALPFEKFVRPVHVCRFDPAPPPRIGTRSLDDARPRRPPDRIVHGVAQYGRRDEEDHRQRGVQRAAARQRAGGKEQRVARKKGGHDESRFREDDREQDAVNPRAIGRHQLLQVDVGVEQQVDELSQHDWG